MKISLWTTMCALVVVTISSLSGCATPNVESLLDRMKTESGIRTGSIDKTALQQLKVGVTSKEDALNLFGASSYTSTKSDGTTTLSYTYMKKSEFLGDVSDMEHLVIVLDPRNRLQMWQTTVTKTPVRPSKLDKAAVNQFRVGESTKEDVLNLIGPPFSETTSSDGTSMLMYHYPDLGWEPLIITFDAHNKVKEWQVSGQARTSSP